MHALPIQNALNLLQAGQRANRHTQKQIQTYV